MVRVQRWGEVQKEKEEAWAGVGTGGRVFKNFLKIEGCPCSGNGRLVIPPA